MINPNLLVNRWRMDPPSTSPSLPPSHYPPLPLLFTWFHRGTGDVASDLTLSVPNVFSGFRPNFGVSGTPGVLLHWAWSKLPTGIFLYSFVLFRLRCYPCFFMINAPFS